MYHFFQKGLDKSKTFNSIATMNKKLYTPIPYAKTQNTLSVEDGTSVLLTSYHKKDSCLLDLTTTQIINKDGTLGKKINHNLSWSHLPKVIAELDSHFQWMACAAVGHCRHTCPHEKLQGECS